MAKQLSLALVFLWYMYNNRVQFFTLEGPYAGFNLLGGGVGGHPCSLTVTSDGSVLVADEWKNHVEDT